jgi:hypothetical protein
MHRDEKMAAAPLRWLKIIAYLFSPVDTSSPGAEQGNAASRLGVGCETLGRLKLVFWMVVSVILAHLLSSL